MHSRSRAPLRDARLHLARGDRQAAIAALDTAVPRCLRHEGVPAIHKARAAADRDQATKSASAAVELASGDGLLQTVASEGADVMELVEQAAWRVPAEWLDRLRRSMAEARTCAAATGRPDRAAHRARTRRSAVPAQSADRRATARPGTAGAIGRVITRRSTPTRVRRAHTRYASMTLDRESRLREEGHRRQMRAECPGPSRARTSRHSASELDALP